MEIEGLPKSWISAKVVGTDRFEIEDVWQEWYAVEVTVKFDGQTEVLRTVMVKSSDDNK